MTVTMTGPTRKEKFDAALGLADWTYADFRRQVFSVSHVHLYCVLTGERKGNQLLNTAIDTFIATQLARLTPCISRDTKDATPDAA